MVKECMLSTGKMSLGGLPRNSVVRISDSPYMTSADKQTNKSLQTHHTFVKKIALMIFQSALLLCADKI